MLYQLSYTPAAEGSLRRKRVGRKGEPALRMKRAAGTVHTAHMRVGYSTLRGCFVLPASVPDQRAQQNGASYLHGHGPIERHLRLEQRDGWAHMRARCAAHTCYAGTQKKCSGNL